MARLLLESGADPNSGDMPPLAFAINNGDIGMIRLLLAFGADPELEIRGVAPVSVMARDKPEIKAIIDRRRGTDWHDAVTAGDLEATRARLDAGVDDIDALGSSAGDTALMIAAAAGSLEMLSLLLEFGARADETNKRRSTALIRASGNGQEPVVRALIAHGADLDIADKWGATALYRAAAQEHHAVCASLIDAGARVGLFEAALIGDIDRVTTFLAGGVPVEQPNSVGMTPLMGAALTGCLEVANLLREHGADVTATDEFGNAALHHAVGRTAKTGSTEMLAALLRWGADIGARNASDATALRLAVSLGADKAVAFLLDSGADPSERQAELGRPILEDAVIHGRGDLAMVGLLLDAGADVNAADNFGNSTLLQTIKLDPRVVMSKSGNDREYLRQAARLLIACGADVNAGVLLGNILGHAIHSDDVEMVRLLLDAGAELSASSYESALYNTSKLAPELVELLRERGPTGGDKHAIKLAHILGLVDDLSREPAPGPKLDRLLEIVKEVNESKGNL